MKNPRFYIIAGEASGDKYGAALVNSLKEKLPGADFFGFGGPEMGKSGVRISRDLNKLELIGFFEVLMKATTVFKNFKIAKKEIVSHEVDVLILVDYPGFNLRMAKWAKKRGLKVFYFVAPQTWAWKEKRNLTLKKSVDKLFVILPFEEEYFKSWGIDTEFVGHPMAEIIEEKSGDSPFRKSSKSNDKPIVALLPGSRSAELKRMSPVLSELIKSKPEYHFLIAAMSKNDPGLYDAFANLNNAQIIFDDVSAVLKSSGLGIIKSGTSTLQAALLDVPQIVFYSVNPLSAFIMKRLAKIDYISLPNLILNKPLLTELIQEDLNPQNLVDAIHELKTPGSIEKIKKGYSEIRNKLKNDSSVFERTANRIIDFLQ